MEEHPWFKDWFNSPYYHQLYQNRDDREAADFINLLIDRLQAPAGAKMLDVACGKGRHSIHLADKGFDVTGIDLSTASINEAKKHETEQLHFYTHDMRLPFWINYFDYAFNFFTSFGYFNTRREHDNTIRTIAQSLKPGGTFVMDFLNVAFSEKALIPTFEKDIDGVHYRITKWTDAHHFYKKIEVNDPAYSLPLIYTERVAKFGETDLRCMFEKQGLEVQEIYGDYNFQPYDKAGSPRLILIAKKMAVH